MNDFKVIELDNLIFSIEELQSYYETVKEKYHHLKWVVNNSIDIKDHKVENIYGWAIQSNFKDPTIPCPPYHIQKDENTHPDNNFDVPTELIFGFSRKIIKSFPNVRQTVIAGHPPGTVINLHIDNDEFFKIHIPIHTNNDSYFNFEDEKFLLKEGKAYLINTSLKHGVDNSGNTDRVHLIFKIKKNDVDLILKKRWVLDSSIFNFDILELPNITFNYQELVDYYNVITQDFNHLKWILDEINPIYGYSVQTNLKDINRPTSPPTKKDYSIPASEKLPALTNQTKMVFGFGKKILDTFNDVEELVFNAHTPNSSILPHIDQDVHLRVHFPVHTSDNSWIIFDNKRYNLEAGKVYLVNTKRTHSTYNASGADRVHLLFKIPMGEVENLINQDFKL